MFLQEAYKARVASVARRDERARLARHYLELTRRRWNATL
jgi:hypothetical protein